MQVRMHPEADMVDDALVTVVGGLSVYAALTTAEIADPQPCIDLTQSLEASATFLLLKTDLIYSIRQVVAAILRAHDREASGCKKTHRLSTEVILALSASPHIRVALEEFSLTKPAKGILLIGLIPSEKDHHKIWSACVESLQAEGFIPGDLNALGKPPLFNKKLCIDTYKLDSWEVAQGLEGALLTLIATKDI